VHGESKGDERRAGPPEEHIAMQKITPFLWFNDDAEQAAEQYVSIFKGSRIVNVNRYTDAGPGPRGTAMVVSFELEGQEFTALNGGPGPVPSQAISFVVNCESQAEVDELWAKLSAGGQTQRCGWLKDRFGISWQIIPTALGRLMSDPDREKAKRVMTAMLQMDKIDIAALERAAAGG
jgi:predicted 3-demethylubiquinone-9 3-methyltransferase (glyoxalase superfamily)